MKYTYRYNEQDRLELLCSSFSGMVRTKGETVHTPDFFFSIPQKLSLCVARIFFSVRNFLIDRYDPGPSGGICCCHI